MFLIPVIHPGNALVFSVIKIIDVLHVATKTELDLRELLVECSSHIHTNSQAMVWKIKYI